MAAGHISMTVLSIVLAVTAAVLYGAVVLYGAWIDGRRQAIKERGQHPVTGKGGEVHAREEEKDHGSNRS